MSICDAEEGVKASGCSVGRRRARLPPPRPQPRGRGIRRRLSFTPGPVAGANGKPAPIKLTPELIRREQAGPDRRPRRPGCLARGRAAAGVVGLRAPGQHHKGCGGYAVYEDCSVGGTTHKVAPDLARLTRHFRATSARDVIGLHASVRAADGTCRSRWTGIDIDKHDDAKGDAAANLKLALAVHDRAKAAGFTPLLTDSNGKGGYHVVIIYSQPIEASWPAPSAAGWSATGKSTGSTASPRSSPSRM